jgi:hypothetical protein
VNPVGYVICRLRSRFGNVLTGEFPVTWGTAAEAIVYPTKGDAKRIRSRLSGEKTAVLDAPAELLITPDETHSANIG